VKDSIKSNNISDRSMCNSAQWNSNGRYWPKGCICILLNWQILQLGFVF